MRILVTGEEVQSAEVINIGHDEPLIGVKFHCTNADISYSVFVNDQENSVVFWGTFEMAKLFEDVLNQIKAEKARHIQ